MESLQQISNQNKNFECLLNAIQSNLENDYSTDLKSEQVEKIRNLFETTFSQSLDNQVQLISKFCQEHQELNDPVQFVMGRLNKYNSEASFNQAIISSDKASIKPDYEKLMLLNVPDQLAQNRHYALAKRQVPFEKGSYLGDGRTRFIQSYAKEPRLTELFKSIWVAEKTPESQYVWRARVMADQKDVYKLLKFLTYDKTTFQSIHINTGGHGLGGKGAYELNDPTLADPRISKETKNNICLLDASELQLSNISIAEPGTQHANVYPKQADHIIDTLCEGAKYKATGNGLTQELPFLYKGQVEQEESKQDLSTKMSQMKLSPEKQHKLSYPKEAFGPEQWATYFGNVGKIPSLPNNIEEILNSDCPYFKGKKIKETHLLTLIPKSINETPVTLNSFGKMLEDTEKVCYREWLNGPGWKDYMEGHVEVGNLSTKGSYWAIMTKEIIPDTWNLGHGKKEQFIAEDYQMPTAKEAAIMIATNFLKTKQMLFNKGELIRCSDGSKGYCFIVGNFVTSGIKELTVSLIHHGGGPLEKQGFSFIKILD